MSTKLHTVIHWHSTLPKGTISVEKLAVEIKKAGTYVKIGGAVLLSDRDWRQFCERNHGRRGDKIEPGDGEDGFLVLLANDDISKVAVCWCEPDMQHDLMRRVSNTSPAPVHILSTVGMTYGDHKALVERLAGPEFKARHSGVWFDWKLSKEVLCALVYKEKQGE